MMKAILFAALALACISTAQAGPAAKTLYRMIVTTQWNTSDPATFAKLTAIEPVNVLPCIANMVKGVMGPGIPMGDGYSYYTKIYDFTSYIQYETYKNCSNAIPQNTDAWVKTKTRMGFPITAKTPAFKAGNWIYVSSGNSSAPIMTQKGYTALIDAFKCIVLPSSAAFIADPAYNAKLTKPVSNGWYVQFLEGAYLMSFATGLNGFPKVNIPPPSPIVALNKLDIAPILSVPFKAILIK